MTHGCDPGISQLPNSRNSTGSRSFHRQQYRISTGPGSGISFLRMSSARRRNMMPFSLASNWMNGQMPHGYGEGIHLRPSSPSFVGSSSTGNNNRTLAAPGHSPDSSLPLRKSTLFSRDNKSGNGPMKAGYGVEMFLQRSSRNSTAARLSENPMNGSVPGINDRSCGPVMFLTRNYPGFFGSPIATSTETHTSRHGSGRAILLKANTRNSPELLPSRRNSKS